jgi:hypothetical protein
MANQSTSNFKIKHPKVNPKQLMCV